MTELLERERELAAIGAALAAAQGGGGRCVVIEGPAGIGKTELLAVARAREREAGVRVLSGVGGVLEVDFPYGVARQLFEPALAGDPEPERLLSGAAALARPVLAFETPAERASRSDDSSSLEVLHGLYWLTVNLSANGPVLIAVDDAHWCDGASLRFLLYLRRRLEGLPVVLLMASRPGEPGSEEHLLGLFGTSALPDIVRPPALSCTAVASVLRRELGAEPDPEFAVAAHVLTDGNPFLVRELVNALVERGVRPSSASVPRLAAIDPESVARSVLSRLGGVGEDAVALARAVAVLGGGADVRHAVALAGLGEDEAAATVEALVRVQILHDERKLSFVHPLVRAAIYSDIPVAARTRAHARAAQLLTRAGAEDDTIAAHLLETDPARDPEVVDHLRGAARQARARGAMDVAAAYLRRALTEPPDGDRRAEVLRELGAAELAAGQPHAAAERLAQAAADARDLDDRVSIALMRRHALVLADRIPEAVAAVDEVRDGVTEGPLADLLEAGALGAGHLDLVAVHGLQDRLERLRLRAIHGEVSEPLALAVAALSAAFANRPISQVGVLLDRAIAALPVAHPASDYTIEGQIAVALYICERYGQLAELAQRWRDDARRRGSVPRFISMATMHSHCAYRTGALADAEALAHDALEAAALYGHHFWVPAAVSALINPLIEHGRFDEAESVLVDTRVQERHGDSRSATWAMWLLPTRGCLRIARGRLHDGLADLLACGERYETMANRCPSMWAWRSQAALALAALGDSDRAQALVAEELRLAREAGAPRALGVALMAAAEVAGGTEGIARLEEAAAILASSRAALEHARALVELGAAHRRQGERQAARDLLRQGLELATGCGAEILGQRAREELAASGARLRRVRAAGPESLTPSELRVARMAAAGRSNPEIAQALFLTRRTVETHLTHAYQKLDISSRAELATALGGVPDHD